MTPLQLSQDFEARLEEEHVGLRRYLLRLAGRGVRGDTSEVDDALQESMARALRFRARFDPQRGGLGAWLRTIALRVWIDGQRARSRNPEGLGDEDGGVVDPDSESPGVPGRERELDHLLRGLRPVEREVLVGFHAEGRSVAELARSLGIREGTVKSHLHRARKRVAERGGQGLGTGVDGIVKRGEGQA